MNLYRPVVDSADPLPWDALAAAGYQGGIRYVSAYAWKNITPAEAAQAARSGLGLALVCEDIQNSFLGAQAGLQRAQEIRPLLAELAWPAGRPVYAAVDTDLAAGDYQQTWLGIQAFANALARPAAVYGDRQLLAWLEASQGVTYLWQSAGWTQGSGPLRPTLVQTVSQAPQSVAGVNVDVDEVYVGDWGQHPAPTVTAPVPVSKPDPQEEDDMKQFVAVASDASAADKQFVAVAKDSVWVVAPPFCRSWVSTETDVATLCAQFGQTKPAPLAANTLNRLPITGRPF